MRIKNLFNGRDVEAQAILFFFVFFITSVGKGSRGLHVY